ncbi:MAG: O-antigen ligase family protein [Bacteroidales bacterium]|nr:O-antigen ligase family protein [Bacteroidales bacterium]
MLSKYFALATLIALAIGYYQYFDLVAFSGKDFLDDGREIIYAVDGLMSHKNLYASSLLLMFPFVVYGIFSLKGKWRWSMILIGSLHLFMIFVLKTRAVWVGLAAGAGIAFLILLLNSAQFSLPKIWKKRIVFAIIGGLVLGAGLLTQFEASGRFSTIGTIKSIFDPSHRANVYRIMIWDLTTKVISDNPVMGVGPGTGRLKREIMPMNMAFMRGRLNGIVHITTIYGFLPKKEFLDLWHISPSLLFLFTI